MIDIETSASRPARRGGADAPVITRAKGPIA
jgi:hypothetical protein